MSGGQSVNTEFSHQGVLSKVKQRLRRNRLGELLVQNGSLTSDQLRLALAHLFH